MLSRRELFTAGVAGLSAGTPEAAAKEVEQEATREGQREISRAVADVESAIQRGLLPSLSFGVVGKVRSLMEQFLRSHAKFPDYMEVGSGVFIEIYDWHIKHQQQLTVTRLADGRYTMQFMFTSLILRPEHESGYVGYPYDRA